MRSSCFVRVVSASSGNDSSQFNSVQHCPSGPPYARETEVTWPFSSPQGRAAKQSGPFTLRYTSSRGRVYLLACFLAPPKTQQKDDRTYFVPI